ncbi:sensor histidine kinase [Isoptericola jiangsuensis]|uniref:sensor histidine kinase n=1 Tax=Isoptericola jiangsuensis TaxID=548579 RepID=UPI003AAFC047
MRVGTPRRLPPGAGLTLHRAAQEALSNVRKHAGPDPGVTVVERWESDAVVLEVSDDGRGAAAGTGEPGYGLLGMRERAAMFGGNVVTGPRPGGGWRVRFTMPLPSRQNGSPPPPTAPASPPAPASPGAPGAPAAPPTQEDR